MSKNKQQSVAERALAWRDRSRAETIIDYLSAIRQLLGLIGETDVVFADDNDVIGAASLLQGELLDELREILEGAR
ncbi:MAG TPA: hypothetical protein VN903_30175 [Polyangia bacterium]|nr:hypothetical protein [Polyangia bacterium]